MAYAGCKIISRYNKLAINYRNGFKRFLCLTNLNHKIFKVQDDKDFEANVIKSEIPVIVDFQATWCGPCKLLEPRLETIIGNKKDKVHLAKVDIDSNAEIAMKYDVQAVPHVIAFKDGQAQNSFTGLRDEDQIQSFINEVVGE